jgi:hypothetical protein
VPPVAVAVNVTDCPTVTLEGPLTATARESGLTVIVAEAVAVAELASVAVTITVYVPLVLYVAEKLAPVPVAGVPPVAVQLNV